MAIQDVVKALDDPVRRRVLELLREDELPAGELARQAGVSPSGLSYHLSTLKEAGLVREDKRGRSVYYTLNLTVLEDLTMWLKTLAAPTEARDHARERRDLRAGE